MQGDRRVALVLPALDEEASIDGVVRSFRARPEVDLVLVVDNASRDRTAERARGAGAVVIAEPRRGYGAALVTGIERALELGARIVVLAEADGTFDPADLAELLGRLEGCDLVLGSRSASLPGPQRQANRLVAGLLAALWVGRSCRITDVGCTLRAFGAEAWAVLRPHASSDGPEFSPQMIGAAFRERMAVREIPVRYLARAGGASKHTGSTWAALRTALRMLRAILAQRLAGFAPSGSRRS